MATRADKSLIQKKTESTQVKSANKLTMPALAIVAVVAVVAGLGLSGNPMNAANANVERQVLVKGNAFKLIQRLEDDIAMQDMMNLLDKDGNYREIRSSAKDALAIQGLLVNSRSEEMILSLVVSQFIMDAENTDLTNKIEALAPVSGSALPKAAISNWKQMYFSYMNGLKNVHFENTLNQKLNAEKVAAATTMYSANF